MSGRTVLCSTRMLASTWLPSPSTTRRSNCLEDRTGIRDLGPTGRRHGGRPERGTCRLGVDQGRARRGRSRPSARKGPHRLPHAQPSRTTALSQVCICGKKLKKPLLQRRHVCACGVNADRDLFSAFLGRYVSPVGGKDQLDLVGAQKGYGPRRQDIASIPEVERAGLAPGKPRVTRRHPPGRRSQVRIAKRLGRAA